MVLGTILMVMMPAIVLIAVARLFLHHTITLGEFVAQIAVVAIISSVTISTGFYGQFAAFETHNGKVNSKKKEWVSCEHSYQCNCTTTRNRDGTTSRSCQTCYEHSNDWDWKVYTTVGGLTIPRVDRRGSKEPPRWSKVVIGEPASLKKPYMNYVKGSETTLFKPVEAKPGWNIPSYPRPYDYYRMKRVLRAGSVDQKLVDKTNSLMNSYAIELGPTKQINPIIILTSYADNKYAYAVQSHWKGGEKNDAVIVIGLDGNKISWSEVFSWSKNKYFNVGLSGAISDLSGKDYSPEEITGIINQYSWKHWTRIKMEEFEYLKDEASVPGSTIMIAVIVETLVTILLMIFFHLYDIKIYNGRVELVASNRYNRRRSTYNRYR